MESASAPRILGRDAPGWLAGRSRDRPPGRGARPDSEPLRRPLSGAYRRQAGFAIRAGVGSKPVTTMRVELTGFAAPRFPPMGSEDVRGTWHFEFAIRG